MFGKKKKELQQDIKKLEAKIALLEHENKMLKLDLIHKDKKIENMLQAMSVVKAAKRR